jgi:hypothetical protein
MNRFGTFLRQWLPTLRHTWYLRILLVLGLLWMGMAVLGWGDILLVREISQWNALPTSPDGRLYAQASGTRERRIQRNNIMVGSTSLTIHELDTDAPIQVLPAWGVMTLAYGHNNELVATASQDRTVQVWRLADGALLHTFTLNTVTLMLEHAETLDFSPDDSLLAVGTRRGGLFVWRVADGTPVLAQPLSGGQVKEVDFSPDGRYLAVAHPTATSKKLEHDAWHSRARRAPHRGAIELHFAIVAGIESNFGARATGRSLMRCVLRLTGAIPPVWRSARMARAWRPASK